MSKFNVGDKVRYIGSEHEREPEWYPPVGTIGEIIENTDEAGCYVQWPKGSTSKNDCWYCNENDIELVENVDMTNEEIWKMLRPKIEKNSLKSVGTIVHNSTDKDCSKLKLTRVYAENDIHNAIAIAYRSGYLRAMKGRPFKFGEKKKRSGHWEPVDPNNLPKEGTRVRYSRECKEYKAYNNTLVILGDLGKVDITPEGWFGIRLDNPRSSYNWLSFHDDGIASCLDMWVEDNE